MKALKGLLIMLVSLLIAGALVLVALHLIGLDPFYNFEASIGLVKPKTPPPISQTAIDKTKIASLEKQNAQLQQDVSKSGSTIKSLQSEIASEKKQVQQLQTQLKAVQTTKANQLAQLKQEANLLIQLQPSQAVAILQKMPTLKEQAQVIAQMTTSDAAPILGAMKPSVASQLMAMSAQYSSTGN